MYTLFLIQMFFQSALANDGYAAKGAGGIVFKKSENINMLSEVLTITSTNVNVKYEFELQKTNDNKIKNEEALIAFPMPMISCGYWGKPDIPEDFSVIVDGEKINFKQEIKAFKNGVDVSNNVKKSGLPLDCRQTYNNKKLFKLAQKIGWADDYKGQDPEDVLYTTQITYYWTQKFITGKKVIIEHSYSPVLGADSGHPNWFFNLSPHWDRAPEIKWQKFPESTGEYKTSNVYGGKSLSYILVTANTWKMGGVTNFKLVLKKDNPEDFLGSTLGPLTKIDETTFEFRTKDFSPDRNLTVFFGSNKSQ